MTSPSSSRPIPAWLRPVRGLLRAWRRMGVRVRLRGKEVRLGQNSYIGAGALLQPPRSLVLADNVAIGPGFFLQTDLEVGEGSLISAHVSCVGHDHDFSDPNCTVWAGQRLAPCRVVLEGDNLIGFGTTIVGNVRIGKGVVVGANSLVTKDLPPYTICYGSPAVPRRPRFPHR